MARFFSIPDKEKDFQSYMLYVLCLLWTVVTAVVCSTGFILSPNLWKRWLVLVAGALFIAQSGTGITIAAVVNAVALVVPQVVAAPLEFLGAIYQLYNVEAVKPLAL